MGRLWRYFSHNIFFSFIRRRSLILAIIFVLTIGFISISFFAAGNGTQQFPLGIDASHHNTKVPQRNLTALFPRPLVKDEFPNQREQFDNHPAERVKDPYRHVRAENLRGQPNLLESQDVNIKEKAFIPPYKLVHFDLKGAPPKISYYAKVFPILKEAGANGILLEYEDMFPFTGALEGAAAGNAYSKKEINFILSLAKTNNLMVIPLVQTFGHLEFALKLKKFESIREVDEFPQAICPSRNESFRLVEDIIDQVMKMHPGIKWLHIGCDEVYHLGYCPKCIREDRDTLFLSHVARVARYVRMKHKVIPIVWDDMLRQMSAEKLKFFKLGELVEPMVWTYVKDVYRFVPYNVWEIFSEVFPNIWAAGAFKGAFGETLTVPNAKMHLDNNEAWLEVMGEQHMKFKHFHGIVITGWQRYDHLATLCELFPSGFPSLILSLLTVNQGFYSPTIVSKFHKLLQCSSTNPSPLDFNNDPYLYSQTVGCFFPGSAIYRMTEHLSEAIKRINDYIYDVTIHKAWLTDYNVRRNYSSPMRIEEALSEYSSIMYLMTSLLRNAKDALRDVYDEYTVSEWIEQNIYPYILKMEVLWKNANQMKKIKTWQRRPLPPLEELKKYSVGLIEDSNNINKP